MRFLASCAVLAVLPFCMQAAVVSGGQNYVEDSQRAGRSDESSSGSGNWAVIARAAEQCARDVDPAACVAVKAAAALERAARMGNMQLVPGVTLARNDGLVRDSRALPTEEELRGHLSSDSTGADGPSKAAAVLANSAIQFLQSRSLRFDFPHTDPEQLSRAIEEGRGKLKKKVLPILGLLAVKIAAVLPILLGIIGFFALKALVFGKLALLIAGVLALQKFSGSSGGLNKFTESFSGNIASPWPSSASAAAPSSGGYYRRSMEAAAQQMAYNGQLQPSVVSQTSA